MGGIQFDLTINYDMQKVGRFTFPGQLHMGWKPLKERTAQQLIDLWRVHPTK